MKRLILLVFGLFLLFTALLAQRDETVFGYSGLKLTGLWGGPSIGISKFGDDYATFRGGFGGLEFNNAIFIGYGAAHLSDDLELEEFPDQDFDLIYRGLVLGYNFNSNKIVHPKLSLLTGGGTVELEGEDDDGVFVLQPALGAEVNIFRWFRVSLEGGYRFITNTDINGLSDSDLSTPFAELKFRFGISWGW